MGTYAKRESGETATSWPLTPTEILASSRRASGSTSRTVCSLWLATTRTPDEDGAEWLELAITNAITTEEATNSAGRRDMQHLDRLEARSLTPRLAWHQAFILVPWQARGCNLAGPASCKGEGACASSRAAKRGTCG